MHWIGPLVGAALAGLVFATLKKDGDATGELARLLEEEDEGADSEDSGLRLVDDE